MWPLRAIFRVLLGRASLDGLRERTATPAIPAFVPRSQSCHSRFRPRGNLVHRPGPLPAGQHGPRPAGCPAHEPPRRAQAPGAAAPPHPGAPARVPTEAPHVPGTPTPGPPPTAAGQNTPSTHQSLATPLPLPAGFLAPRRLPARLPEPLRHRPCPAGARAGGGRGGGERRRPLKKTEVCSGGVSARGGGTTGHQAPPGLHQPLARPPALPGAKTREEARTRHRLTQAPCMGLCLLLLQRVHTDSGSGARLLPAPAEK